MQRFIVTAAWRGLVCDVFEFYSQEAAEEHATTLAVRNNFDSETDDLRIWATDPGHSAECVEVWSYDAEAEAEHSHAGD